MKWFQEYPRDEGSTDFCDSARLAGMMIIAEWPQYDIPHYFDEKQRLVRSPKSDIEGDACRVYQTFSRDQLIPLIAGQYLAGWQSEVKLTVDNLRFNQWICPNEDLLSPSQRGHIRRCMNLTPTWIQEKWLYLDIMYSAHVEPMEESNQLIAMLVVAGPKWVDLWKKHNKRWRDNIRQYWCSWRNEPELAERLIFKLERIQ